MRLIWALAVLVVADVPVHAADRTNAPTIHLEVVLSPGLAVDASQRWYRLLTKMGVSGLRIRQARPGEAPDIVETGTKNRPAYRVTAVLQRGEQLYLPGRRQAFRSRDLGQLKAYLTRLAEEGIEGVTASRGDFGLTGRQLNRVQADLARVVDFSTQDQPIAQTVMRLAEDLELPLVLERSAERALGKADSARDELRGLAAGTVLAFLLRQEGLTLRPESERGKLVHRVRPAAKDADDADAQRWPVGWQPKQREKDILPVLFEFLEVRIENYTLQEVLTAMQPRIEVPFLIDHAGLQREGIQPDKVVVKFPPKKTFYKRVLKQVLFQAKLKGEVRLDEAGKPFYWITTLR